jgi:hypothetical protein
LAKKVADHLLSGGNDAGAGVQEDGVIQDVDLDAGRIAADFECGRTGDRDASANPPERYGEIVSHQAPLPAIKAKNQRAYYFQNNVIWQ